MQWVQTASHFSISNRKTRIAFQAVGVVIGAISPTPPQKEAVFSGGELVQLAAGSGRRQSRRTDLPGKGETRV